jgi:cytochrome d ubiquinol oxidase subunit I
VRATFEEHSADLGFAYLLCCATPTIRVRRHRNRSRRPPRTRADRLAAFLGLPHHGGAWLRLHRGDGLFLLSLVLQGADLSALGALGRGVRIPTPWIAAELGWFVAEFGRQPWTVDGVLPTALSASHLSVADLLITLAGFMLFYSILFVVEMGLMLKYIRKGPFQDVEETEAWEARHEHRLRTHDGKGPFAPAGARGIRLSTMAPRAQAQPLRSKTHDPLSNSSTMTFCG